MTGAPDFENQDVDLSGRLEVQDGFFSTAVGCRKGVCCNRTEQAFMLDGGPDGLILDGLGCGGDESRRCCDMLAMGQPVIVRGTLVNTLPKPYFKWKLTGVYVCELAQSEPRGGKPGPVH